MNPNEKQTALNTAYDQHEQTMHSSITKSIKASLQNMTLTDAQNGLKPADIASMAANTAETILEEKDRLQIQSQADAIAMDLFHAAQSEVLTVEVKKFFQSQLEWIERQPIAVAVELDAKQSAILAIEYAFEQLFKQALKEIKEGVRNGSI